MIAAIQSAPKPPSELPELRDIAPPLDLFPYPPWMIAVAAVLILALLAGLAVLIRKKMRDKPPAAPPTPREVALRELEALRSQVERQTPYEFSIAVSDILRRYIGRQYRLLAREQTSAEFLSAIACSARFSENEKSLLAGFLERCDLIKFARIDATTVDSAQLLASAIDFANGERI